MKSFLYVMVEDVPMLMDSDAVYEVMPLSKDREKGEYDVASGYLDWRNQLLPIVNARELLELPLARTNRKGAGVVYCAMPEQPPIFLIVDEIVRMIKLELDAFVPLPQVPNRIRDLFDLIYIDNAEGRQAYRFRNPLQCHVLGNLISVLNEEPKGCIQGYKNEHFRNTNH